ncbi:MAG: PhzF family phenazine biosynthesis protein, partial [Candidatus Hodarchaeota archaeon]
MREFPFIRTSVFTDDRFAFSGNQLATFWNLTESDMTTKEMQGITREFNLSETTFVLPATDEISIRKVRIFTPGSEIPFAGHPTLGTAFVLKRQGIIPTDAAKAYLGLGIGPTAVEFAKQDQVRMHQSKPQLLEEYPDAAIMAKILGISPSTIADKWPMQFVSTGFPFLIVPLTSLEAIKAISLDSKLLLETFANAPSQALVVFTLETAYPESHAHVRMFAPSVGVLEDPATGSAAGPLGAYLEIHNCIAKKAKGSETVLEQGYEM